MSSMPSPFPSSFDPAVHLHSEDLAPFQGVQSPPPTSDDLQALHLQRAEVTAFKTKEGIVIQHRAWNLRDVFQSEEDHRNDSPLRKRVKLNYTHLSPVNSEATISPPRAVSAMAPISSPVQYPLSSSPPQNFLKKTCAPINRPKKTLAGFLIDDDEDEENSLTKALGPETEVHNRTYIGSIGKGSKNEIFKCANQRNPDESILRSRALRELASSNRQRPIPTEEPTASPYTSPSTATIHGFRSEGGLVVRTCSGKTFSCGSKLRTEKLSDEQVIAARSRTDPGRAKKSYYGIDIHNLLDDHALEKRNTRSGLSGKTNISPPPSLEISSSKPRRTLMWTEKYRARKFTDLVGDDRTHRQVLKWVKGWDPIVFPGSQKQPSRRKIGDGEEKPHRKVLLLTGPPGLGKTTLAHVCARQAGYEVQEINASENRSKDVIDGRIRNAVGNGNVRGLKSKTATGVERRPGRPACIVVDEVDGVVGGSGNEGEGGFIKALIDLILTDQKNSSLISGSTTTTRRKAQRKGENFRLLRPLILICNDVYHPALRPLRQSNLAEIVYMRKPPLSVVSNRLKSIFEREGFPCDGDGVRRLCEAAWGISSKRSAGSNDSGAGEGDIRGAIVVAEWAASKLRATMASLKDGPARLTRSWVEEHMVGYLSGGKGGARGLGRGGSKEVVERVFKQGAGFPNAINTELPEMFNLGPENKIGVAEMGKRHAMECLRGLVDACGESDRVMTDCFTTFPTHQFQDDTILSKPCSAYDWLHFHDSMSSRVFTGQEWELAPYLSQSILAFHDLFGSSYKSQNPGDESNFLDEDATPLPFTGPRADWAAHEAAKHNKSLLQSLQSNLSISLARSFRSPSTLATDLLPYLNPLLSPAVKPIVVGGSGDQRGIASVRKETERAMVERAVKVMTDVGVTFEKGRVENELNGRNPVWVYRMEPQLDALAEFETLTRPGGMPPATRYAVRQVMDQEFQKEQLRRQEKVRQARYLAGNLPGEDHEFDGVLPSKYGPKGAEDGKPRVAGLKRDFFGRVLGESEEGTTRKKRKGIKGVVEENKVWVSFHEGFSNAVRKPITLEELMIGL